MKSSLKFCVIAAGEYDGYVAEPRACEWDIAAGHAILKNAGGTITLVSWAMGRRQTAPRPSSLTLAARPRCWRSEECTRAR